MSRATKRIKLELYLLRGTVGDVIELMSNASFLWRDTLLIHLDVRSWLVGVVFDRDEHRLYLGPLMFAYIRKHWHGSAP